MSRANAAPYEIREWAAFTDGWKDAVRDGHINQMTAGSDLAGIKLLLAQNPYRVPQNADLISDLRVITYQRTVRIWYSVVEDDRIVYLENVTIARG